MQAVGEALDIFLVAGIPLGIDRTPEARRLFRLGEQRMFAAGRGHIPVPDRPHPLAVDQHHRGVAGRDGEIAVLAHLEIEEKRRIGEVDLVDVVVDRLADAAGEVRDGVAVVGEAGAPAPAVEAPDVLHQVDLVGAGGITHLLDRVEEDALGPVLRLLRAEEDPDGRPRGRRPRPVVVPAPPDPGCHGRTARSPRDLATRFVIPAVGGGPRARLSQLRPCLR